MMERSLQNTQDFMEFQLICNDFDGFYPGSDQADSESEGYALALMSTLHEYRIPTGWYLLCYY